MMGGRNGSIEFGCEGERKREKRIIMVFFFFKFYSLFLVALWLWIGVDSFGLLWRILVFHFYILYSSTCLLFLPLLCRVL